jgi:allantoinase
VKPRVHGPYAWSPIIRRPRFSFPNGARVAIWIIPNIEFFALSDMIPVAAGGGGKVPDVPGFSIRDYGNRIGVFRMMETMARHGARGTVALNSDLCKHHPEIIEECLKLDWEFMGHNETNTKRLNEVPPGEDGGIVRRAIETIARETGQRPKGWLGSGLQETWNTLEHLVDNGLEYVADWMFDDQPIPMTLDDGRTIMSVPYSYELNDKPAIEKKGMSPDAFAEMIMAQFDTLWREGETQARVMAIALHPYITGMPHRIRALDKALDYISRHDRVWFATGAEIAAAGRGTAAPA